MKTFLNYGVNAYSSIDSYDLPDHAVTIIGWDDNYSKENFVSGTGIKPKNNGAYIALNSWGEEHNSEGYYYISYEDQYVETALSGIVSTNIEDAYKVSSIKNDKIRNYLKNNFGHLFIIYDGEEYITKNTISKIYAIDLSSQDISSLEGIEIFSNLYFINLADNNISDVSPLTKLKNLTEINLSNNKIKDISELKELKLSGLNLSNNSGIKGYEKIVTLNDLNISGCNIDNIENLNNIENLIDLYLNDNKGISGFENLSLKLNALEISNCDISNIKEITEKLQDLSYLNLSENPISDWNWIKEYTENNESVSIEANNCNITDISIFNDLKIKKLILKQNNIKDISNFNNDNIYYIDLSENEIEKGFETLKNAEILLLNNCNIRDISEIAKMEKLYGLSLEDNDITDISQLSKMENLKVLSLAGNKNLNGTISNKNIEELNLSNCNLDNTFDFSKMPNLMYLIIKENNNLTEISKIINELGPIEILLDEISIYDMENLNEYMYCLDEPKFVINRKPDTNKKIELSDNNYIKQILLKNMTERITVKNGSLSKDGTISIEDVEKGSVELQIEIISWFSNIYSPTIIINFAE